MAPTVQPQRSFVLLTNTRANAGTIDITLPAPSRGFLRRWEYLQAFLNTAPIAGDYTQLWMTPTTAFTAFASPGMQLNYVVHDTSTEPIPLIGSSTLNQNNSARRFDGIRPFTHDVEVLSVRHATTVVGGNTLNLRGIYRDFAQTLNVGTS